MSRLKQLSALSSLLAGRVPADVDWMAVLALANEALVTPQVHAALGEGSAASLPAEVRAYLQEIWVRNRARNRRLFGQLRDAVAALNAAGIEPTLLKGAAHWAALGRPPEHDRMLIDLDVLVTPDEAAVAVAALEAAGFVTHRRHDDAGSYVAAELARPQDVGLIDLHRRPPGPEPLVRSAMAVPGQAVAACWDGVRAKAPSPALQVFLLVLHDQFQDGGYWRGEFALRHLLDIAALSRLEGGVDWGVVARLAETRLVRNATDAQLLAAATTCGALAPRSARRVWVRLQHMRLRAQFRWPHLNPFLVQFSG